MVAFTVSFLFSAGQTFLLKFIMDALTSGREKKSIKFFILKFILYGVAIALFMFKYLKYAVFCFCGFAAGMPLTAFALFIYSTYFKKK